MKKWDSSLGENQKNLYGSTKTVSDYSEMFHHYFISWKPCEIRLQHIVTKLSGSLSPDQIQLLRCISRQNE